MHSITSFFSSYITLGIFSFFQMTFFPGYLLFKLFNLPKSTVLKTLVHSIILSMLCNYLFSFYTSLLGVFNNTSIFIFILSEIFLFIYLINKKIVPDTYIISLPEITKTTQNKAFWVFLAVFTLSFLYVFKFFVSSIGDIFSMPDMIGSYNNWATDWAINGVINPALTMKYPLLFTANWAFTYKLMGINSIQFFTKPTIILLPLSVGLILLDQFWNEKSTQAVTTLFIWVLFLIAYISQPLNDGTFDVASGCVAFIAFLTFLEYLKNRTNKSTLYLALTLSATAALVKQAGILTMILGYSWAIYLLVGEYKNSLITKNSLFKNIFIATIITLIIGISWYAWINWQIYLGQSTSESEWLMKGIHNGRNFIERFFYSLSLLIRGRRSMVLFAILFIPQFLIVFIPKYRNLFFLLTLPFFIFWAFFFGYDTRTLALVFPFIAFSASIGMTFAIDFLRKKLPRAQEYYSLYNPTFDFKNFNLKFTKNAYVILALLFAIVFISMNLVLDNKKLENLQITKSKQISDPEINQALYTYFEGKKLEGFIASQYGITKYLPSFSEHHFPMRIQTNIDYFKSIFRRKEIHYIFLRDFNKDNISSFDQETFKLMEELQNDKKVTLVLDIPANGYKLFEITHE